MNLQEKTKKTPPKIPATPVNGKDFKSPLHTILGVWTGICDCGSGNTANKCCYTP
jgi:hypothetical protein